MRWGGGQAGGPGGTSTMPHSAVGLGERRPLPEDPPGTPLLVVPATPPRMDRWCLLTSRCTNTSPAPSGDCTQQATTSPCQPFEEADAKTTQETSS